jgi:indole-3-glycerol phosphate synthase
MATYLEEIISYEVTQRQNDRRSVDDLMFQAKIAPKFAGFLDLARDKLHIIAEFKRRSPSKGDIANDAIETVVQIYEKSGVSGLSILTNEKFFKGSKDDLVAARSISKLPILRKDFTVDVKDVLDAKIIGASAILLIVKALAKTQLEDIFACAKEADIECIVEVHGHDELETALNLGAQIIGVNRRDLNTFEIKPEVALDLIKEIPLGVFKIVESGFNSIQEIAMVKDLGYDAILIGEFLMKSSDKQNVIKQIRKVIS